jgi:hypothetical protein
MGGNANEEDQEASEAGKSSAKACGLRSTGAKLAVLAGRPSKHAVTVVFGSSGYALSWLARADRLGITPERLWAKFKADPDGVKADWAALTAKKG